MKQKKDGKKSKQKLTRKQKKLEQIVVLKEKVRDVKINQKQHFFLFIAMMVLVNTLLVASVAFVVTYLNMWYNWVLCFAIVGVCAYLTLRSYIHVKNFHKCSIHKNAIVMDSVWFNFVADLKKVVELNPKKSILDKMFKLETYSLEVKMIGCKIKKYTPVSRFLKDGGVGE